MIATAPQAPDHLLHPVDLNPLPPTCGIADSRAAGNAWIMARLWLGVIVPSPVIGRETNILVNPAHPDMAAVSGGIMEPFAFDDRML